MVKIAQVLDEIDRKNKAVNLGKRNLSMITEDQKVESPRSLIRVDPKISENNRFPSIIELPAAPAVDSSWASVDRTRCDVMDVVKREIK